MVKLEAGDKVRIIAGGGGEYHYFKNGDIVEYVGDGEVFRGMTYNFYDKEVEYGIETQYLRHGDYEILSETDYLLSTEANSKRLLESVEKIHERVSGDVKQKRVKYLYSVVDSHGDSVYTSFDREDAREWKAYKGGKANGFMIMAYAPVKEIR